MFKKSQLNSAQTIYEKEVIPNLKPHDGAIHVIMINSFSKFVNQNFGVETKYTNQLGYIIDRMQYEGYQVLDVKFDSLKGQGISGTMEGFHTLIMYK
ncbi:hypothetical protein DS832_01505 [Bombilactobacillus bombi]|uniref:Uncharacterized protein n=1 Tax=Bombilactobacillus bombi TaxID=1303590 RepID=A0A417ZC54_9LACO|nr:hypothetical protein [Bombilactobacillus bombi]RHW48268.1 hypothetical protein DS832_01505 [Bombilactobacillus bombi]